ncbi:hypothetical protein HH213_14970 [Duganella dendranthematis]|uniref:Uncharacterized protein n=1 Tax=Duganella dendranthematis TaxID=2728021 RepID=A0ABX6MAX4_9BURK|nr:hypothetical protein [Duganella dendranthematis]QJD91260.1 hypothetical protein HH213_14970 [Duganella dendranthematis]
MNATADKKPTLSLDKKTGQADAAGDAAQGAASSQQKDAAAELREAIKALDTQRNELVKSTIENIKPGKPLDLAAVREINKIETKKNRLIVSRFAALLKKNPGEVQAIVHQIIEI